MTYIFIAICRVFGLPGNGRISHEILKLSKICSNNTFLVRKGPLGGINNLSVGVVVAEI